MKLAIMQPYFLPYIGYFSLIKNTDHFILFDTTQFIRHGWIERNRILKPDKGWIYIKVPLEKHSRNSIIKDIKIREENWQEKILAQCNMVYKKRAKYYKQVMELIKEILFFKTTSIAKLNAYALENVCNYLNIDFKYSLFSEMNLKIDDVKEPDEWALNISKAIKAEHYVNLPGGQIFFNQDKYRDAGIEIDFIKLFDFKYDQKRDGFEPGLSILDIMMFNSPEEINRLINNYTSI